MPSYLRECGVEISFENKYAVQIIQATAKGVPFLEALEALWQMDIKALIITRDKYVVFSEKLKKYFTIFFNYWYFVYAR